MPRCMVSFRGSTAPAWVLDGIRDGSIASVCLFAFNADGPEGFRALASSLRDAARDAGRPPPLIGIDQEGGQLMALSRGVTGLPGNMALGATASPALARRAGEVLGRELAALGINLDFAPVLDLAGGADSAVIGTRAFGDDPELAGRLGAALVRGLQAARVLATAKHFPGHGGVSGDSHHERLRDGRGRAELEPDLRPFRDAVRAGVDVVMASHVRYPALDDAPASRSSRVLRDLLRGELGFTGLSVTDAMDMAGVADLPPLERCAAALEAGADLVMLGHLEDQPGLVRELARVRDPEAEARIERVRARLPDRLPPLSDLRAPAHLDAAREIAEASIWTAYGAERLPLSADRGLAVVTVRSGDLSPADTSSAVEIRLAAAAAERRPDVVAIELPYRASPGAVAAAVARAGACEQVIAAVAGASGDPSQAALVGALARAGRPPVIAALRSPHDLSALPRGAAAVCAHGLRDASVEALVRVLFGEIASRGRAPVRLSALALPASDDPAPAPPTGIVDG